MRLWTYILPVKLWLWLFSFRAFSCIELREGTLIGERVSNDFVLLKAEEEDRRYPWLYLLPYGIWLLWACLFGKFSQLELASGRRKSYWRIDQNYILIFYPLNDGGSKMEE